MSEPRCGTCKWFDPQPMEVHAPTGKEYHPCLFPLPFWIAGFNTEKDLGKDCKAYAAQISS